MTGSNGVSDQLCTYAVAGGHGSEPPLHAAEMRAMAAANFAGIEISGRESDHMHTCSTQPSIINC